MRNQADWQRTLRRRVAVSGVGVHSSAAVTLALCPADAGSGIIFQRTDLEGADGEIAADFRSVIGTDHSTRIGRGHAAVATIEHVMAALRASGIDNARVEIDGPEAPIMDGSAEPFLQAIDEAGVVTQSAPRRLLRVLRPVRVEQGSGWAELRPFNGSRIDVEVDFSHALVGKQRIVVDLSAESFRRELARARTFGFLAEVERLWAAGMARGATIENCVVIGDDRIVNPEGLRFSDEFARHKALDAVGDLALAGAPIVGEYRSYRGGHALNLGVLQALFADRDAWSISGAAVPSHGHAEVAGLTPAAAFGPQVS